MQTIDHLVHGSLEVEDGVQLHFVETGTGSETVVLIHGYPETWWQWRFAMPLLAEAGFHVLAFDYRGAGNSSKPTSGYDKRTMARDIQHLLRGRLKVNGSVAIVGHDIGMTIAFAYAAQFPTEVHKLVLVDAILPGTKPFRDLLTTGRLKNSNLAHFFFHNARNNMAETLTAGRERIYLQDFFDRIAFNVGAFSSDVVDVYAKAYAAPGAMKAGFEVYRAFDQDGEDNAEFLRENGRLRVPTLFIAGQESFLSSIADEILGEITESGSSVSIPSSGHYPAEENPVEFVEAVVHFLKSH